MTVEHLFKATIIKPCSIYNAYKVNYMAIAKKVQWDK